MIHISLRQSIAESTSHSKRAIAKAARKQFNASFDVVCSTGEFIQSLFQLMRILSCSADFSYLANTRIFCEHKVNDITCFAFEH